ncbi:hypothetical protein CO615_04035 [Lysobacteraceae bacterium NML75-0749]|nr:hypothetical protein CO615_04035 [Xanthomonadaceae bacterium NML75-0749]
MSIPVWQPGHLYPPGAVVLPRTRPAAAQTGIANPQFDDDLEGWAVTRSEMQISTQSAFLGSKAVMLGGGRNISGGIEATAYAPCEPGASITATCWINQGASSKNHAGGSVFLRFYDANNSQIREFQGNQIKSGNGFARSSVTASAPAGTKSVRIGANLWRTGSGQPVWVDAFSWNLAAPQPMEGLMYRAVQPKTGRSATTEPAWPPQLGQQVTDNEVIWEAVRISRIVWKAIPLLVSGDTEPIWPTDIGASVADNTISWVATSRQVIDPKCPKSKTVVIAASKVFAADGDIIPFSATANPLDWSSPDNAGFLPSGLQLYGANPIEAMGLYRGNLVAMNVQGSQVWQVDEDPALMALLDAFPIGSQHHKAIAPVSNDLFVLTQLGVRTLGVAAGATNLQAGDVGQPVDPMVQAELDAALADGAEPFGLYNPNAGQYWLGFKGGTASKGHFFVYTMNRMGQAGAWTRYEFPWRVDDWCIKGEHLYLRHGDTVSRLDMSRESDAGTPFEWFIQWPWLDFGQMGVTKMMQGFDIIGTGQARIEFGYDQTNGGRWTPAWELIADSVPGQLLPMPLAAPSIAVRLTYQGNDVERTGWEALNLHFSHFRVTS